VEKRAAEEKRKREEGAKRAPPAWLDPALIAPLLPIGIKVAGIALRHRGLLLALISFGRGRLGHAARARRAGG